MSISQERSRQRIVVPQRPVQGGFDFKFETDPYNVKLHNLLTATQYTSAMEAINEIIAPARSGKLDGVLLMAGVLMVPLALWGIRHSNQTRRRKRLLHKAIENFNAQYSALYMRWNRSPESCLTIERRKLELELEQPPEGEEEEGENGPLPPSLNAAEASDMMAMVKPIIGSRPSTTAAAVPTTATATKRSSRVPQESSSAFV
jgi:hypothetical protein